VVDVENIFRRLGENRRAGNLKSVLACPRGANSRPSMPDRANSGTNTRMMIIVA
jgi:hypothetical protein